ncbi:unnamed protein product [Caenorhabditis bovis]|uniref:Uncharacterized protein n=1 Tax=Caenorhabditis bovis TaxID=2654633 RepID=A0A8S1F388_9PELO|nr:unnamed protein product [Caenorhabditis bovis]
MGEIGRIVAETLKQELTDEQCVFDKCLRLVGSNRDLKTNDIGFCLLARMISRSNSSILRTVQTRLANRFAQISQKTTFSGCLFTRELLIRNPQAGEIHSQLVFRIIANCIDQAVESDVEASRILAAELFALRANNQTIAELIETLDSLLSSKNVKYNKNGVLQLSTFGVSSLRPTLINILFECLSMALNSITKQGVVINRNNVIKVIELGIRDSNSRQSALMCLRSICINAKSSTIPMIARIVSTLLRDLENPDVELIKTLSFISTTFGPITSTIYRHFYVIFTALPSPLHEQEYGIQAAELFSSIIEGAGALIKPEVFVTVQKAVCENALKFVDSPVYIKMLSSFLALNNEYVPSPLQIARYVSHRTRTICEDARRLKCLCDVASRPRVCDIGSGKTMKSISLREQSKISVHVEKEMKVEETPAAANPVADCDVVVLESDDEEDENKEREECRKKENEDEDDDGIFIVEKTVPVKRKATFEERIEQKQSEKKKKISTETTSTLLDGEATTDEILELFDFS